MASTVYVLPVDTLLVDAGSVYDVMCDGLVRHVIRAADAHSLVPGDLATKTPVSV